MNKNNLHSSAEKYIVIINKITRVKTQCRETLNAES